MDNRFFRRVKIDREVEAVGKDGSFTCYLKNISLGGVFLGTAKPISAGEQLTIKMPLRNEYATNNFTARLIAIRRDFNGTAFIFDNLDPKNFWTLQAFINYAS